MASRRRGDMHDVRLGFVQKLGQVAEIPPDGKPLVELPCHEQLPVTDSYDLASPDPQDLGYMSIRDLSASHDAYPKHAVSLGSPGSTAPILQPSAPSVPSPAEPSASHCYSASSSTQRAIADD